MKKIIALVLALASILSFASCGNTQNEITTATLGETTSADIPSETTKAPVETTAHTWNYPEPIVPTKKEGPYYYDFTLDEGENEFESFYKLYPERPFEDELERVSVFVGSNRDEGSEPVFIVFRVLAREELPWDPNPVYYEAYHIQVVDYYGNVTIDTQRSYRIMFQGTKETQRYAKPPFEIGGIYGRFLIDVIDGEKGLQPFLDEGGTWGAFSSYVVNEIDGKRYIYSSYRDLSEMDCAIPITDPEENSIYKVGKHDKQIAELERMNLPMPTYDYKCELDAFYEEMQRTYRNILAE